MVVNTFWPRNGLPELRWGREFAQPEQLDARNPIMALPGPGSFQFALEIREHIFFTKLRNLMGKLVVRLIQDVEKELPRVYK